MQVLLAVVLGLALLPVAVVLANSVAFDRGWWRLLRVLGRLTPYVLGSTYGGMIAFQNEAFALRELGKLTRSRGPGRTRSVSWSARWPAQTRATPRSTS